MDPKSNAGSMSLAPQAQGSAVSFERRSNSGPPSSGPLPPRTTSFPPVDQHIVRMDVKGDEIIRGRKVAPRMPNHPHAEVHSALAFLLAPHVQPGFQALNELTTRAAVDSDFCTDVCVCRVGKDPETGSRYLEELSFEVVNEQSMRDIREKAEDLVHRGVRRFFAIFVKKAQVCEWSKAENKFVPLNSDGVLDDPLFVRPIAMKAMLDLALGEVEVARALILKGNAAIEALKLDVQKQGLDEGLKRGLDEGLKRGLDEGLKQGLDEGLKRGLDEGLKRGLDEGRKQGLDEGRKQGLDEGALNARRETLLEQLKDRFGAVPAVIENRIQIASLEQLRQWSKRLFVGSDIDAVIED